ncbi:integrase, catalytic region, zinc finger, CCHC-type containing protein, partial [Tanacetum coccineum]
MRNNLSLETIEEQLVTYRKNEVLFSEEVAVLKREVTCKDYEIGVLKSDFEKVKQEKEGIDFKIEKFDNASKSLDKLLESQINDNSEKGLRYHAVPPPHPLIYNALTKLDLSYSGLDEFKEPKFIDNSEENTNDSLIKQVSDDESSFVESPLKVDKTCTIFDAPKKIEFVKPKINEIPVKKSVRYAEMYRPQRPRGNQRNWNGQKSNQLGTSSPFSLVFVVLAVESVQCLQGKYRVGVEWRNLEDENVSLDFKVQSLTKERDNAKMEYKKLFDSIKKTRSQTQKEIDELIAHVSKKTYAYGAIRAENQNLLSIISELKDTIAFKKKSDVPKTEETNVVSKPVTLQTSPTKQTRANQNTNVIRPGMYRVVTTQESQTSKTKSALSSTGMNATSRVRRPMSRDSHVAHSVLDNSKKEKKNVAVYVRKNKQEDVIPNKENVIDVDVANASKAKTLLCVSCMKNVLIPCHDKCVAKHKLNVRSNIRRTFSTNSRSPKSSETTFVAPKTRFSEKKTQSKTLDTTFVVSKSKIDVESASKAKDKVVQIVLWVVDNGCSKHMTGDRSLLRNFIEKFMGTVRFGNDNFAAITGYGDYMHGNIIICHVYYVEGDDLLTGGRDTNLYTISISDMAASSPVCLMSKATSTKSWLWHRRLSHLNFGTINDLTRLDLVDGLPKFKYGKDHLCSACEMGKRKKASNPPKLVPSDHSK